ncbi:MAG TPA: energy-coupling factor transporter transmembrane component T [Candidatus Dormibacteraeota bacterium]|jgi:energy-coupling factor transport system permease protein
MSPRAVAAWSGAAMAMVVLTNNPVYRTLITLVALNFVVARRRPGISVRGLLAFLAIVAGFTIAYNPLISHAGAHRLATIPATILGIGGAVTLESIIYGASAAVGLMAAALAVAPLVMVLEPGDLLDVLPGWLQGTGTALTASLNLVPTVARSFTRVREAELLRGSSRLGPRTLLAIIVPVALTTIESSITLAEAMEARAYGSGPRTRSRTPGWGARDGLVMVTAVLAAALVLGARVLGDNADWYPFPTLAAPDVSPVLVAACLLLIVPVAIPRRSRSREAAGRLEPA